MVENRAGARPPLSLVTAGQTAEVLGLVERPAALLTSAEQTRAAAFRRAGDRDDFVAAHVLARICAGQRLGVDPAALTVVQHCATCGGPHGQPSLREAPDLAISLAHTRGQVAAAAGAGRVGVDIEALTAEPLDDGLVAMALTDGEAAEVRAAALPRHAFLRYWVAKESLVKVGVATLDELRGIDLAGRFTAAGDAVVASHAGLRMALWSDADTLVGYAGTEAAEYVPARSLTAAPA